LKHRRAGTRNSASQNQLILQHFRQSKASNAHEAFRVTYFFEQLRSQHFRQSRASNAHEAFPLAYRILFQAIETSRFPPIKSIQRAQFANITPTESSLLGDWTTILLVVV
jgi:hypothetical protein